MPPPRPLAALSVPGRCPWGFGGGAPRTLQHGRPSRDPVGYRPPPNPPGISLRRQTALRSRSRALFNQSAPRLRVLHPQPQRHQRTSRRFLGLPYPRITGRCSLEGHDAQPGRRCGKLVSRRPLFRSRTDGGIDYTGVLDRSPSRGSRELDRHHEAVRKEVMHRVLCLWNRRLGFHPLLICIKLLSNAAAAAPLFPVRCTSRT